jgi:hypothetical protein
MKRTNKEWPEEDVQRLKELVLQGASPHRAGVALKRSTSAVQTKAREIGSPFPARRAAMPGQLLS